MFYTQFFLKIEYIFIGVVFIALSVLGVNFYNSYAFKHNPLPKSYIQEIEKKEQEILGNMQKNIGVSYEFPLVITDKISGRLYGLTSYENGVITIYLNKKVMQESMKYILSDVIAHEYAHALLFEQHRYTNHEDGHSLLWKKTCKLLGGKDCKRYVNQEEIIMSKMPFH